jgi:hypothetical protein
MLWPCMHAPRALCRRSASRARARRSRALQEGSYALKGTVESLESKIMQVEVQYAGRLQAQKAKNDQQAAIIQSLLERVQALEARAEAK